jgi:hypothetical protein
MGPRGQPDPAPDVYSQAERQRTHLVLKVRKSRLSRGTKSDQGIEFPKCPPGSAKFDVIVVAWWEPSTDTAYGDGRVGVKRCDGIQQGRLDLTISTTRAEGRKRLTFWDVDLNRAKQAEAFCRDECARATSVLRCGIRDYRVDFERGHHATQGGGKSFLLGLPSGELQQVEPFEVCASQLPFYGLGIKAIKPRQRLK